MAKNGLGALVFAGEVSPQDSSLPDWAQEAVSGPVVPTVLGRRWASQYFLTLFEALESLCGE